MRMKRLSCVAIIVILLGGCSAVETKPIPINENRFFKCEPAVIIKKKMVILINEARNSRRRCGNSTLSSAGAVQWNNQLAMAARNHARDMARNDMISHTGSDGSTVRGRVEKTGYRWRIVGENISAGHQNTEAVVSSWLESPGHCANLMNSSITEVGAACFRNSETRYGTYWTLVMATQSD